MKHIGTLCVLLFFLPQVILKAHNRDELSALRLEASIKKDLKSYSDVCDYFYTIEEHPEELLLYADSIRQLAVRDNSLDCYIEYYNYTSEAFFMKGDFQNGFAWKRKALDLAERNMKIEHIVYCSSDLGYYYNIEACYDSARYYIRKGILASENVSKLSEDHRILLTNYASSYLYEGKTDSALVYTLKAKECSFLDKDTTMLIENLNQLGSIYRRKKNLDESIRYFEQALYYSSLQENFGVTAFIYSNIATVYCEWGRLKDALPFSEKAVEYALKSGNKRRIGTCYVNLGTIQARQSELRTEGINTLLKAIPMLEEVNDRRQLCVVYDYLVNTYRKDGQLDVAKQYLQKLDKLSHELQTEAERYRYYQAKAALLKDSKNYSEAIVYYQKIISMLQSGYKDTRDYDHYLQLSECYRAINSPSLAYESLQQAYKLRDAAFRSEQTEQLSDFSVKYQTKEKELEIVSLRREQLEQEATTLRHRIIIGSVIALLIISLLGSLYARQRQRAKIALLAQAAGEKERQFLELQQETEQRLTRKYIDGLESERERMATELHDDVCNSLLALEMNIRTLSREEDAELDKQLGLLNGTRERLRTLSHELMPPAFQYATLDEMLSDYVLHLPLPAHTHAEYHSSEGIDWNIVPKSIGFECYRIVQEAVNNAMKYAEAACIRVEMSLENNHLSILVSDDGKGFDKSKKTKGIGLQTIRQRAAAIGAKVELDSAPGEGTRLNINVIIG